VTGSTVAAVKPAQGAVSAAAPAAAAPAEPTTPETGAETPGTETGPSDGPGGHEDPAGQNVDHQFDGEE
jgi:hypothetical protein